MTDIIELHVCMLLLSLLLLQVCLQISKLKKKRRRRMGQVLSNILRNETWMNSVEPREEEKINKGVVIKEKWTNTIREEENMNKGVVIKEKYWTNTIDQQREEEKINKGVVIKEKWTNTIDQQREEDRNINKGVVIKEKYWTNTIDQQIREEEKINKGVAIKEKWTSSREPIREELEIVIGGMVIELQKWMNSIEPIREEEKIFNKRGVVIKEIWMNDYCSLHKILLVGEGDFSFSVSLAVAFGTSAPHIIATSLNSIGFLRKNYGRAMSNIQELTSRGCKVVHGVDATEMTNHLLLNGMKFDRIVFNFPLAGFFPDVPRKSELRIQRNLVEQFLENAKKMIASDGEIHVRHKSNRFFRAWNLELLGSNQGLQLIEEVPFDFTDYPGYRTKYGFGSDKNFDCYPSKTYKFGLP